MKSGLIIAGTVVTFGALVLLCLWMVPVHRIESYLWRIRYGNFVTVGQFRFPVPKHWYVEAISTQMATLVDLDNGDGILLRSQKPPQGFTLARWSQLQAGSAERPHKIRATRVFSVKGERLLCIERDEALPRFRMHSIECRTETGLDVLFTPKLGLDTERQGRFYSLVDQIQRRK